VDKEFALSVHFGECTGTVKVTKWVEAILTCQ
jgi:hypothetical protein